MSTIRLVIFSLLAITFWSGTALYGGLSGWWLTPIAKEGKIEPFYDSILKLISEGNKKDIALILIEDGQVSRQHFEGVENEINGDTLFATASFSKWVTAYSVMTLVESGALDLDATASTYLKRWNLPESNFNSEAITIRQLLSHTSGLGDGLGFGDFLPSESLPSLVDSLNNPRASSGEPVEIKLTQAPGDSWNYSGGGYLVLQLIIEEASGLKYADYVKKAVFDPLNMTRSNFDYIGNYENRAEFYDSNESRTQMFQYEASAATGLLSSANDLVNYTLAHISGSQTNRPVSLKTVQLMQKPVGRELGADIWGSGVMLYAPTGAKNYVYGHDGSNDPAINTSVRINPNNGDAIIVLVSGNSTLASTIGYHWVLWQTGQPDFLSFELAISSAFTPALIGSGLIIFLIVSIGLFRRRAKYLSK